MNHPQREEWVPYLYGEATPEDRRRLKEHLRNCADCRVNLEAWRQSLNCLDAWKLPRRPVPLESVMPFFKWAAAAALVLAVGFGIGRLTTAKPDAQQLQALIERRVRQELTEELTRLVRQEVRKSAAATLEAANRQTDATVAASNQALYLSVKHDLDTLAVNTDLGLQQAEQQLVQLASEEQPANLGIPSNHH